MIFSAKPQEYKARLEQRLEAKKEVLGQSKQAEFVRFMEQEVRHELDSTRTSQSLQAASTISLSLRVPS